MAGNLENGLALKELEAKNKAMVLKAYQTCFGDQDFDAVDTYFHSNFIAHNPNCANDSEGLKEALRTLWATGPKKVIDVRRCCAEGDLVWIHLKYPDAKNPGKHRAIIDIFRVENGKIAEHWDVVQPMDDLLKDSKNPHPFF